MELYKPKTILLGDCENLEALKKELSNWELEAFKVIVPNYQTEDGNVWKVG